MFCLDHVGGAAAASLWAAPGPGLVSASATPSVPMSAESAAANGLPLLHSLPGATAALFIDFDGYFGGNGISPVTPYDTDGDATTFNPTEQAEVREAWRQVASYFSMFNLDVTTQEPGGRPYSYSVVGNSVASGYFSGIAHFPTTLPVSFNSSGDARTRLSALAHEAGHAFGLEHQSDYDRLGNKVNEYSAGPDPLHGPIMGVDFAGVVHKWIIGHSNQSPVNLQDDVAVIAARIAGYTGAQGVRPDDAPGTFAEARPLGVSGATPGASGIIERLDDADAYTFDAPGGPLRIDLVPPAPSMLDGKLEVYAEDGTLLAAADSLANDQHLLFPTLPRGRTTRSSRATATMPTSGPTT